MIWNTKFIQIILRLKVSNFLYGGGDPFLDDLKEGEIIKWSNAIRKKAKYNISLTTLKRILRNENYDFYRKDARVRKALHAIALTFGYKGWEHFLSDNVPKVGNSLYRKPYNPNYYGDIISKIIIAKKEEYGAYLSLPDINVTELEQHYVDNDPELVSILSLIERRKTTNCYLHRPTSFYSITPVAVRILSFEVIFVDVTEEWYLVWNHADSHRTIEVTEQKISKTYCVCGFDGDWFINSDSYYYKLDKELH